MIAVNELTDIKKTQHFTINAHDIIGNLIKYLPSEPFKIIEPFAGNGDLLIPELFSRQGILVDGNQSAVNQVESYDVEPIYQQTIKRDTLLSPPDYKGKWVITNPPYLARNKATDKSLYELYDMDDLYKIAMSTMDDALGGILVIPTNFMIDERTAPNRQDFFNHFQLLHLNVFNGKVFENTTYNVCALVFRKHDNDNQVNQLSSLLGYSQLSIPSSQTFKVSSYDTIDNKIVKAGEDTELTVYQAYGYQVGGDYFNYINQYKNIFGRVIKSTDPKLYTNLFLTTIDTRYEPFNLSINHEVYVGKSTDRTHATLTCQQKLTANQESWLVDHFNQEINQFRKDNRNMVFTIFRDGNRHKISFKIAYKWLSKLYIEMTKLGIK